MDWKQYFEMMSDWKRLPAYKAEPRVDSLIGFYLKDIISEHCNETIIGIVPELPIRLGTVKPDLNGTIYADRSYKVDFYLLASSGINYLVEFKTDSGSRREKQDLYLQQAKAVNMEALVRGISQIAKVSSYKNKYNHLLGKLEDLKLIDNNHTFIGKSADVEIIYVQPHITEKDNCICFKDIADWMRKKYGDSEFELELANTLEKWGE